MRTALLFIGPALGTLGACTTDRATTATSDAITVAERLEATRVMAVWNTIALRTTAAGPFSPPRETRTMAMVSAAVFDAVNTIDVAYEPFLARMVPRRGASIPAAVATAAYRVLHELYPAVAALDADYSAALAAIPNGEAKDAGIATGEAAATATISARKQDHAADQASFTPRNERGMWAPTPPAFVPALEPGWGHVTPFGLDSGSQFRPPPPPVMGSATYLRDLTEIAAIGASNSTTRTATQTEVARFWIATAPQLWNQVARQLTVARDMAPAAAARAYLLLNAAGADAMIAAWDAKYVMQQWRPITAIRRAVADGVLGGSIDTTWTSAITTPPFPDYPAGHTAYAGAAEVVLAGVFGDQPAALDITSQTADGATHHYQRFSDVADEVVDARVWGGVHWRTSSVVGRDVGRKVGATVLARVAAKR